MPIDCKIANTFDTFPFAMPRQEKREMGKKSGNGNGIGNGNENRHLSVSVCVCVDSVNLLLADGTGRICV